MPIATGALSPVLRRAAGVAPTGELSFEITGEILGDKMEEDRGG